MANEILTELQEKMITYLIAGENISDVAKKINVSRQTVYTWLKYDHVKVELDRRRQDLASQGNEYIRKDLLTYIDNIKDLANKSTDQRVKLAANQYLLNRVYGTPKALSESEEAEDKDNVEIDSLQNELYNFKRRKEA